MVREYLEVLLWRKEHEMEGEERGRSSFGEVEMELQEGKLLSCDTVVPPILAHRLSREIREFRGYAAR
jgi:hypothetical protein